MSLPQTITRYTVDEYLALERESEERHEYLDGQIYAMAGESIEHADISVNLVVELRSQLKGTPCRVWTKDSKVLSGPAIRSYKSIKGLFSYPDIVVVCGEPRFLNEHRDVLLNPTLIIEVLSPSTESFDRGEKFWRYRSHLASLTDYVQVSQALPLIEHFRRQSARQLTSPSRHGIENLPVGVFTRSRDVGSLAGADRASTHRQTCQTSVKFTEQQAKNMIPAVTKVLGVL
jgi:Uma2 family endonuclease